MLAERNEAIHEASAHLHILTKDEKIRLQCEAREMYERDIATIRKEGLNEGISQGQQLVNQLNKRLLSDNRLDDLHHAITDSAYQEQLMKEYGILPKENP